MSQIDNLNFDEKSMLFDGESEKSDKSAEFKDGNLGQDEQELNDSNETTGPEGVNQSEVPQVDLTEAEGKSDDDVAVEKVVTNTDNQRNSLTSTKGRSSINNGQRHSSNKGCPILKPTNVNQSGSSKIPRELMYQKLEEVKTVSDTVSDKIERVDTKMDQIAQGITSLLEVNQNLKDSLFNRITDLGMQVKGVDTVVLKSNSIRHEAKLQILEVKMHNLEMLLGDIREDIVKTRMAIDISNEHFLSLQVLDSKVDRIRTMIQSESTRRFTSALNSSVSLSASAVTSTESLSSAASASKTQPEPEKSVEPSPSSSRNSKRTRNASNADSAKPKKQIKRDTSDDQVIEKMEVPLDDLNKDFTYACRHGVARSIQVGHPMEFDRQCRFQANIIGHLLSHRQNQSHGEFLRDGSPAEASFKKVGEGQFVCIKKTLKNKECGKVNKSLGLHNRHSRSALHRDDILLVNKHCKPCKTTFKTEALLLDHVSKTKCLTAKGVYGVDSIDPEASGITCPSCGREGFSNSFAVLKHQQSSDCVSKEDEDYEDQ